MKLVTIYGERCSGTNYLEQLLLVNFNVEITWVCGWKHFFGFDDLTNKDNILFIGIVRNLYDWINSLYREKHHLPTHLKKNVYMFLSQQFYSVDESNKEIITDRNIETKERYKNIFQLRCVKNRFLIEKMPTLVKNYCLITYDDLLSNFTGIMNKLKDCGLEIKNNIQFPLNIRYYKDNKNIRYRKKINRISNETIDKYVIDKELFIYEKLLFPTLKR
jgi:hypothetical protein